jgi:Lon protease-like protein
MDLPCQVPIMTLPDATLFPGSLLPLHIFEPRYRRMLKDALETSRVFAIAMRKPGCKQEIPLQVAGLGMIRVALNRPDGTSNVVLQGLSRVALMGAVRHRPYRIESAMPLLAKRDTFPEASSLTRQLRDLVSTRLEQEEPMTKHELLKQLPPEAIPQFDAMATASLKHFVDLLKEVKDPGQVADLVGCTLLRKPGDRQIILETVEVEPRLRMVIRFLKEEIHRAGF